MKIYFIGALICVAKNNVKNVVAEEYTIILFLYCTCLHCLYIYFSISRNKYLYNFIYFIVNYLVFSYFSIHNMTLNKKKQKMIIELYYKQTNRIIFFQNNNFRKFWHLIIIKKNSSSFKRNSFFKFIKIFKENSLI